MRQKIRGRDRGMLRQMRPVGMLVRACITRKRHLVDFHREVSRIGAEYGSLRSPQPALPWGKGHIKDRQGADRFSMRGLERCRGEWQPDAAVHNLRKLHQESVKSMKKPGKIMKNKQYGA